MGKHLTAAERAVGTANFQKLIGSQSLTRRGRIEWRGEELARHYASADLFLFPSLTDTFGNVTLEALASGLVVVAFDTAAAALHIRDGISGCLAPVEPVEDQRVAFFEALAQGLAHARPGSALRLQAVQAARRADWDCVLRHFERRLRAVAAGAAREAPAHAAVV